MKSCRFRDRAGSPVVPECPTVPAIGGASRELQGARFLRQRVGIYQDASIPKDVPDPLERRNWIWAGRWRISHGQKRVGGPRICHQLNTVAARSTISTPNLDFMSSRINMDVNGSIEGRIGCPLAVDKHVQATAEARDPGRSATGDFQSCPIRLHGFETVILASIAPSGALRSGVRGEPLCFSRRGASGPSSLARLPGSMPRLIVVSVTPDYTCVTG